MSDVRSDADDLEPPALELPLPELDPALLAEADVGMDQTTAELVGPDAPAAPAPDCTVTMELGELDDALAAGAAARRAMEAAEVVDGEASAQEGGAEAPEVEGPEIAAPVDDSPAPEPQAARPQGEAHREAHRDAHREADTQELEPPPAPVAATAADDGEGDGEEDEEDLLRDVPLSMRVEAVLFAATEPVSMARLRNLVNADDARDLRSAVDSLAATYAATGRAFLLEEVAGGFQIRTRPELSALVTRSGRKQENARLSGAALETLAIVAYRQPVLRADIEKIRGVASGEVLRTLIERELVRVTARAELPGAPLLYGTTSRFLELFGLRNVRDLPRDPELLRPVD